MAQNSAVTHNGKAVTIKKTFSRQTTVSTYINANTAIIWALLTDAQGYPRWNNAVVSIEGKIAAGEKIRLTGTLAPKRVFKLTVKEFIPNEKLVWGDAIGSRVYYLTKLNEGETLFTMDEKIGGPLFPLFAGMILPFDEAFEQFAEGLKTEAEKIMNTK